jgi:hypothetical protein
MSDEKVPALEIEETEVKPIELPKGAKLSRKAEGEQDFGKDPRDVKDPKVEEAPDDGSHPLSGKDSGSSPRATARRSKRDEQKEAAAQKKAFHKYVQQMQKPVRHGEMHQILQHIEMNLLAPKLKILEDLVDKLQLLPDFIGNCLNERGQFDIEPSLETFEDFFEKYTKRLEEEAKAEEERLAAEEEKKKEEAAKEKEASSGEEGEPVEGQALAAEDNEETREDVIDTPETEETQKE